jgi:hypothetical protein
MAPACLLLACKVEEQAKFMEDIIKTAYRCLLRDYPSTNTQSEVSEFNECFCVFRYVLMMVINSKLCLQKIISFIYGLFTDTGSSSDHTEAVVV